MPLHPSSLNLILWKTRCKFTTIFWITKNKPFFFWLVFDFYCFSLIFSPLHSGCRFAIKKSFDLSCAMICGKGQLKMPSLYTYSPFPIRHKRDFVLFVNPQCKMFIRPQFQKRFRMHCCRFTSTSWPVFTCIFTRRLFGLGEPTYRENSSLTWNIPPKGVSFSDFMLIFILKSATLHPGCGFAN